MKDQDFQAFSSLISDVAAFYRQDVSQFLIQVWWNATRQYDLAAVSDALSRHCCNPDNGQFMPKPGDVIRFLTGRTVDSAQVAWAKTDKAVRSAGPYQTVVFDDPIIHKVIEDMGGWIDLCSKGGEEWPFIGNQFVTRYQGYKITNDIGSYQAKLTGLTEHHNEKSGRTSKGYLTLIGDRTKAEQVMLGGNEAPRITATHVAGTMAGLLAELKKREEQAIPQRAIVANSYDNPPF